MVAFKNFFGKSGPPRGILRRVLDVGFGAVAAGRGLGVPFAVGGLVFDRLGTAGHALLGGGAPGGGQCRGVGRKRFGKYAADRVGPAAVMLNDFVGDMTHGKLAVAGPGDGGRG